MADTERAVGLLTKYQASLTSPEEQALKTSVAKVSSILGSELFQALLGKKTLQVQTHWYRLDKLSAKNLVCCQARD